MNTVAGKIEPGAETRWLRRWSGAVLGGGLGLALLVGAELAYRNSWLPPAPAWILVLLAWHLTFFALAYQAIPLAAHLSRATYLSISYLNLLLAAFAILAAGVLDQPGRGIIVVMTALSGMFQAQRAKLGQAENLAIRHLQIEFLRVLGLMVLTIFAIIFYLGMGEYLPLQSSGS